MKWKRQLIMVVLLLATLTAMAVTPEVGKDRLRSLVKLPAITFQPDWTFDPELGFTLGSDPLAIQARIEEIRKSLHHDSRDAEQEQTLADLYTSLDDQTNASNAWSQAAGFYRQRVDLRPGDAVLLSGLGVSLARTGKAAEAETMLRRAVLAAPKEWKCQIALGRFLDGLAREALADGTQAEDAALAQSRLDEAGKYFNQAVVLAPKESEVYLRRGLHRTLRASLLNQVTANSALGDTSLDPLAGCFPAESVADLRQASRLDEDDFTLAGSAAMYEIYGASATRGRVDWNQVDWSTFSFSTQSSLRETINRLEGLGQNPDNHVAAGALEELGILQGPILHQVDRSIASLEQAVALQPSRHHAWEVLVATLAHAGRNEDLLSICQELVKKDDTSRAHLLLAKAYERLKNWDSCEEEARQAADADPEDATTDVALAALLLRRSNEGEEVLSEADDYLSRAESAIRKVGASRRNRQQVIDLTLTRGIYFALNGQLDTARHWVQTVLDRDRENQLARDILSALDF